MILPFADLLPTFVSRLLDLQGAHLFVGVAQQCGEVALHLGDGGDALRIGRGHGGGADRGGAGLVVVARDDHAGEDDERDGPGE